MIGREAIRGLMLRHIAPDRMIGGKDENPLHPEVLENPVHFR